MNRSNPFGRPGVLAYPLVTTVSASACAGPADFYRRMRRESGAPMALLESSETGRPSAIRSIVAVRCPLRVELLEGAARIEPLEPDLGPLLAAIEGRLSPTPADPAGEYAREDAGDEECFEDGARLRQPGALDSLRALAGLVADAEGEPALPPGLFGAFGYEIVDTFEDLPPRAPDPLREPDASFLLATDLVVYDHVAGEVQVITRRLAFEDIDSARVRHDRSLARLGCNGGSPLTEPPPGPVADGLGLRTDVSDEQFCAGVTALQEQILAGEIFQAVLSRGFEIRSAVSSLDVYAELTRHNPSPYMFHLDLADGCLLGASPETFLRCEDGEVEIRPIAGTVPRGEDEATDRRLALQMLLDPKEQAEHAMLLDLARNDVARISQPGTIRVVQQFEVEKYSHVQHLVSRVRGRLLGDLDALHAYRAAANMGTLTGAPKLRAMELIRELEPLARGFYGGAAGYLLQDGRFDSCIVIRSLRHKDGVYYTRAGAGVVLGSDPARELQETAHKARACLEAVARAAARAESGPPRADSGARDRVPGGQEVAS